MPSKLIPELLEAYHDHHLSGHFGVHRTWLRYEMAIIGLVWKKQ